MDKSGKLNEIQKIIDETQQVLRDLDARGHDNQHVNDLARIQAAEAYVKIRHVMKHDRRRQ